jgi:hypothetical protein
VHSLALITLHSSALLAVYSFIATHAFFHCNTCILSLQHTHSQMQQPDWLELPSLSNCFTSIATLLDTSRYTPFFYRNLHRSQSTLLIVATRNHLVSSINCIDFIVWQSQDPFANVVQSIEVETHLSNCTALARSSEFDLCPYFHQISI